MGETHNSPRAFKGRPGEAMGTWVRGPSLPWAAMGTWVRGPVVPWEAEGTWVRGPILPEEALPRAAMGTWVRGPFVPWEAMGTWVRGPVGHLGERSRCAGGGVGGPDMLTGGPPHSRPLAKDGLARAQG